MPLPATERILLGPGPSLIAPRVMRALTAPVLSHLDPDFVPMLDDVRYSLQRLFLYVLSAFLLIFVYSFLVVLVIRKLFVNP